MIKWSDHKIARRKSPLKRPKTTQSVYGRTTNWSVWIMTIQSMAQTEEKVADMEGRDQTTRDQLLVYADMLKPNLSYSMFRRKLEADHTEAAKIILQRMPE